MKRIILVIAMLLSISAVFAQNTFLNPIEFANLVKMSGLKSYATGGFKVAVLNTTTKQIELTNYVVCQDTVNGSFYFLANGASNAGFTISTPTTFLPLVVASRSGKTANIDLTDTSGSKYLELNSHDGITSFDTTFINNFVTRVETIYGTKSATMDSTKVRIDCNKLLIGANASAPFWTSGTGTPNGVITAPKGSLYSRLDAVVDSTFYTKDTGSNNLGWYPVKH